ncbi:MAG: biosynthetic-type acetolactate synthase large subunit [Clostridia bacterium]|nr:biosynthetic-type acetolactate synthase large subunit [Clostridia bacterium]
MKISGAQAIIKALEEEGIKVVFGYPGGAVLPLYDSLLDSKIKHVLIRQEQNAVHSASGYARSTGGVGVCIATSGPGATNMITGIATAYMDSIPIVAITGQVSTDLIGKDVFQEVDITGATAPFCKHNYLVKNAQDIPGIVKEAFYIAATGRPGPVLIDLPIDVSKQLIEFDYPDQVDLRGYKPTYKGHHLQIKKFAKALKQSKRPVICAGGGVISSDASELLVKISESANIPVTTTLMGIGSFPDSHPNAIGMVGQHGNFAANNAISKSDLLIVAGARLGDRATGSLDKFAKNATLVHIDIDPAEIGKNISIDIPIVGDLRYVLEQTLKQDIARQDDYWIDIVREWKVKQGESKLNSGDNMTAEYILDVVSSIKDSDCIAVTDVGQHQIWAGRYLNIEKPGTFLTSGGLGTMGYGLPAAIGAKIANRDKQVMLITGDGSFQMTFNELATIVQEDIGIKIIIFNNNCLGMVRELQQHYCNGRYSQVFMRGNPDFVSLAKAYGIEGIKVDKKQDVEGAIKYGFSNDNTIVIEFLIDDKQNVLPVREEV